MNREYLFLGTFEELRGRLHERSPYNLVKSTGLLRQLFLDERPLVNIVKKSCNITPVFRARPHVPPPVPGALLSFTNPCPDREAPERGTQELPQDRFLALPCGSVRDEVFTVKHLIRFGAHVLGGVHNGVAKEPADHVIQSIHESVLLGNMPMSLYAIEGIGQVTLTALDPLFHALGGT